MDGVRVFRPIFPAALIGPPSSEDRRGTGKLLKPRLRTPDGANGANSYQRLWLHLLPQLLDQAGGERILWVSSPLTDYLVAAARPEVQVAVYDCMDDLASFRDGTEAMRVREAHLLETVDLVFTGGYSMYQARKERHPHVYCFPSGVDVAHFRRAQDPATQVPAAVELIPHPRLGYFGVLDERIDWRLIGEIAYQRPDWHWVLVGPVAKVHPGELPGGRTSTTSGSNPMRRCRPS